MMFYSGNNDQTMGRESSGAIAQLAGQVNALEEMVAKQDKLIQQLRDDWHTLFQEQKWQKDWRKRNTDPYGRLYIESVSEAIRLMADRLDILEAHGKRHLAAGNDEPVPAPQEASQDAVREDILQLRKMASDHEKWITANTDDYGRLKLTRLNETIRSLIDRVAALEAPPQSKPGQGILVGRSP